MGRGGGRESLADGRVPSIRRIRSGLDVVNRHYAERLLRLPAADRYRLGSLTRELMRCLGVNVGPETSAELVARYLPERAAKINRAGLKESLRDDGLEDVGSFRSALIDAAAQAPEPRDEREAEELWQRELSTWRALAQSAREREFDWLARHLRYQVDGIELDESERQRLLLELWHDRPSPYVVEDRASAILVERP